jgi:hypothetical protein
MEWHEDYQIHVGKVFFRKKEIVGADPKSFRLINYGVARDARSMFFMGKRADGVDPDTYELVEAFPDPSMPGAGSDYFRTRDGVFYDPVEGLPKKLRITGDPASFRCLANSYATDGVNIFFNAKKLSGAQLSDWGWLGHCYYSSNGNVYNWGRKLKGVSASEFEALPGWGEFARFGSKYFHCWGPIEAAKYIEAQQGSHVVVGTVVDSTATYGLKHMEKRPDLDYVDNTQAGWLRLLLEVRVDQVLHDSTVEEPVSEGATLPVLVGVSMRTRYFPYIGPVREYQGTTRTLFFRLSKDQPRDPTVLGRPLYETYACLDSFNYADRLDELTDILKLLK